MRTFDDWISAFLDYTQDLKSPIVFRRWAGLAAVASALQRRVWVRIGGQTLYPNLYILLVANPGVGKTVAIRHARNVVKKVHTIKLSPSRITQAAFYKELESASGTMVDTAANTMYRYHALSAMIDEFSVFVRPKADEFMSDLADLFDCPDPFESKTKTQGENIFPNALLNIIGGCTPSYLKDAWSSSVLAQGFPSRIILINSEETTQIKLFDEDDNLAEEEESAMKLQLASDLTMIASLKGRFTWAEEASRSFMEWYDGGMKPTPADPRLIHYQQRRIVHIAKLCMVISASKRGDLEITLDDFKVAKELLLEAESVMGTALMSLGANPVREAMQMVIDFVHKHGRNGRQIPESVIRSILMNEVDPMRVHYILKELILSKQVFVIGEKEGHRGFQWVESGKTEKPD